MTTKKIGANGGDISSESSRKNKSKLKSKFLILILLLVLISLVLVSGLAWLYVPPITETKEKIFETVNLPLARVGSQIVTSNEVLNHEKIIGGLGNINGFKEALEFVLKHKKIASVHSKFIGKQQTEFTKLMKDKLSGSEEGDIDKVNQDILVNYYTNIEELKLFYNSDEEVNSENFTVAKEMLGKIESGMSFADSAKSVGLWKNEDTDSIFSGDIGYIDTNYLPPEIQISLREAEINTKTIIPTRSGVAVVELYDRITTDENKTVLALRVLVIPNEGFESWLDDEVRKISTKTYLKL